MGDIFDSIFGGFGGGFGGGRSANPNSPRRGEDIRANVVLDFMEACKGKTVKLRINRAEKCPDCHGTGAAAGSSPKTCPDCHGTGTVRIHRERLSETSLRPRLAVAVAVRVR